MIGLDIGSLSSEMARVLLLRGTSLPPLAWGAESHRGAKKLLDEMSDAQLLGIEAPLDEGMAAAVRAMCYLWHGWLGECAMFAQGAGPKECIYLSALCERHQSRFAQAKDLFKQLGEYSTYSGLAGFTEKAVANTADSCTQRLKEMLQLDHRWEPYLFCDSVAQAKLGNVRPATEQILQQIQCREFELLLAHCYEQATGCKPTQRGAGDPSEAERRARDRDRRLREDRRLRDEKRQRADFAAKMASSEKEQPRPASQPSPAAMDKVLVLCPKCKEKASVSSALRGKTTQCAKCGTGFAVPKAGASEPVSSGASGGGTIAVICPKCGKRGMLSPAARGKKTTCAHCKTQFLVPAATPAPQGARA